MKKHLGAALSVAVLSLGLLTACGTSSGSGGTSPSPSDGPGGASPSAVVRTPVDVDQWLAEVTAAAQGVTTAHFSITTETSAVVEVEGDMDITDRGNPKATVAVGMSGGYGQNDAIVIGGVVYMPNGDGTYDQLSPGAMASYFDVSEWFDQGAVLARQRDAIATVELVGTEDVEGVQTEHYVVTLQDGTESEYWLDDQRRVVQFSLTVPASSDQDSPTTVDGVFTDFGKAVTIEVPPTR